MSVCPKKKKVTICYTCLHIKWTKTCASTARAAHSKGAGVKIV